MAATTIEWTEATWNPVTGCTKVSPGCQHCYAERMAKRLQAMGQPHYARGFEVSCHEDALLLPLRWKKPRRIFVNSMGDVFHSRVPDDFVRDGFEVMAKADALRACSSQAFRLSIPSGMHDDFHCAFHSVAFYTCSPSRFTVSCTPFFLRGRSSIG